MSISSYTEEDCYWYKDLNTFSSLKECDGIEVTGKDVNDSDLNSFIGLEECDDIEDPEEEDEDDAEEEEELIEYCRQFINTHFYGENPQSPATVHDEEPGSTPDSSGSRRKYVTVGSSRKRKISFQLNTTTRARKFSAPVTINRHPSNPDSLGTLLKLFHLMLTSQPTGAEDTLRGTEDAIFQFMIVAATLRKKEGEKMNTCFKRLLNDCKEFLQIYNKEAATKHEVSDQYWGSCQQLRCGKVIVDHLNVVTSETMDSLFGILLCPFGGQFKSNLSATETNDSEAEGYHQVMYDAFDYLKTYQGIGPGPDYLGALTLLEPNPLEAETTSRLFWQRQIERIREEGIEVMQKYY